MPYVAATAFTHLGRAYAPGDAVDPKPSLLGQLLAAGCIKEVPPPVPVETLATVAPSVTATEAPRDVRVAAERGPHKKPAAY